MNDIQAELMATVEAAQDEPEAQEILVMTNDPALAQEAAPLVLARLHPDRMFGRVLTWEPFDESAILVTVVDHGVQSPNYRG